VYRTACRSTPRKRQNSFAEGGTTSVWRSRDAKWGCISKICSAKTIDIVFKYHNSALVFLITLILAEEIEMGHYRNFWTSVTLTLHQVIWHTADVALTDLYLHTKFHSNRKNFLWCKHTASCVRINGHRDRLY